MVAPSQRASILLSFSLYLKGSLGVFWNKYRTHRRDGREIVLSDKTLSITNH